MIVPIALSLILVFAFMGSELAHLEEQKLKDPAKLE
jgi:hypothetical protein